MLLNDKSHLPRKKILIPINNHMLYVVWEERARSINRKKSDSKFEDRNNCFWCNCFPGSCAGLLKSRLHESSLQITPQEKKKKTNTEQCETEQEVTSVNLQRNFVTLPRSQRRITYSLSIVRGNILFSYLHLQIWLSQLIKPGEHKRNYSFLSHTELCENISAVFPLDFLPQRTALWNRVTSYICSFTNKHLLGFR